MSEKSPIIAREISGLEMAPEEAIVSLYELELLGNWDRAFVFSFREYRRYNKIQ